MLWNSSAIFKQQPDNIRVIKVSCIVHSSISKFILYVRICFCVKQQAHNLNMAFSDGQH